MSNFFITNVSKNEQVLSFISDTSTNDYYLFGGKSSTNTLSDSDEIVLRNTYQNMLFGKRIESAVPVIRNIPYVSNKLYNMYDDIVDQSSSNSYVIVYEGSNYYCYRCLDNNYNANSTDQPLYSTVIGSGNSIFRTADGYLWKYLFQVTETDALKFSSTEYFPIISYDKSEIVDSGQLRVIKVEDVGQGYDNYLSGAFAGGDLHINGNRQMFAVSNSVASAVNGFYTGCLLYISAGSGAGEYRYITDYVSISNGNFIYLSSDLDTVTNGSQFEIYPRIIVHNNNEVANVVARAIVNSSANAITRVEILYSDYNLTNLTANIVANDVVQVAKVAQFRPIYSPYGDHGYDLLNELKSNTVCLYTKIANTENSTLVNNNSYTEIGLIKNPLFSNVNLGLTNSVSSFEIGETIFKISKTLIGTASGTLDNNTLTFSSLDTTDNLVNKYFWMATSNATIAQVGQVNAVTNSTVLTLKSNLSFTCTAISIYQATVHASMKFSDQQGIDDIFVNFLTDDLFNGDYLVGNTSGAHAYVNTISRNDVFKGFNTFVQSYKYRVTSVSGSFIDGEVVKVGNQSANFDVYDGSGANKYLYLYNNLADFQPSDELVGQTSGATAVIVEKYLPEIHYGSGQVMYLENISNVQRNNTTETFKLYLSF